MILCKDCKHYKPPSGCFNVYIPDACHHPENTEVDFVTGHKFSKANVRDFRRIGCGLDKATYYESKEN